MTRYKKRLINIYKYLSINPVVGNKSNDQRIEEKLLMDEAELL